MQERHLRQTAALLIDAALPVSGYTFIFYFRYGACIFAGVAMTGVA